MRSLLLPKCVWNQTPIVQNLLLLSSGSTIIVDYVQNCMCCGNRGSLTDAAKYVSCALTFVLSLILSNSKALMWKEAVLRDYLLVMMLLSSILSHISRKGWCHSLTWVTVSLTKCFLLQSVYFYWFRCCSNYYMCLKIHHDLKRQCSPLWLDTMISGHKHLLYVLLLMFLCECSISHKYLFWFFFTLCDSGL